MTKISRPFRVGTALLALVLANPALAQDQVEGAAAALTAVDRKEVVRVIATVRTPPAAVSIETPEVAAAKSRLADVMRAADARRIEPLAGLPLVVVEVDRAGLQRLIDSGEVVAIQEDIPEKAYLADSGPLVGAPDAWAQGARGAGTAIAILDTGVDANHPFLAGKVVAEACFSTTSASQASTLVCPDGSSQQIGAGAGQPCGVNGCDHGTHVAGIAAGRGASFSGMAPDADIVAIQVFSRFEDLGGGPTPCADVDEPCPCVLTFRSDQIRGLQHVRDIAATRGIVAANMSLGGGEFTTCDDDARRSLIGQLRNAGIATVIASGNDGFTDGVGAPACISTAITVGATTKTDEVWSDSNSAEVIDLLAPGVAITSAILSNNFGSKNGTSMAAPHVAGAFADVRSMLNDLPVAESEQILESTGILITDPRNDSVRPRIDLGAAVRSLGNLRRVHPVTFLPASVAAEAVRRFDLEPRFAGEVGVGNTFVSHQSPVHGRHVPIGSTVTLQLRAGPAP